MASSRFVVFVLAVILFPSAAMAAEYFVGDDAGWTINVNYTTWANEKVFYEGDRIVFFYHMAWHDVVEVDEAGYKICNATGPTMQSGYDVVKLVAGRKWYICAFPKHCANYNMKVAIHVLPAPPPPTFNGAAIGLRSTWYQVFAAVAVLIMV